MDVAALSSVMSTSKVKQQASLSVMKMVMNTGKENSSGIINMMKSSSASLERSVNPSKGSNFDVKV